MSAGNGTPPPGVVRRFVLALPPSAASDASLRSALSIAQSLHLEMIALLLEDERVFGVAARGVATEFATGLTAPRRMDLPTLEADFGRWARRIERRLAAAAGATRQPIRIERVRGAAAGALAARLGRADLLAVLEPSGALDRALGLQASMMASARGVCAALSVPARPIGETGAIVVLGDGATAPEAVALGEALAAATGAPLELWSGGAAPAREAGAREIGGRDDPRRRALAALGGDDALRRRLKTAVRLIIAPGDAMTRPGAARVLALAARTGTLAITLAPGVGARPEAGGR